MITKENNKNISCELKENISYFLNKYKFNTRIEIINVFKTKNYKYYIFEFKFKNRNKYFIKNSEFYIKNDINWFVRELINDWKKYWIKKEVN